GYHQRHAQRAWLDIVALLAECLHVPEDVGLRH
ncbi:dienelactone hydrolase family protein, partial [Salinispora arenicola]|nr:dienelactone hydrolase family protein [Salinispora arenicola]